MDLGFLERLADLALDDVEHPADARGKSRYRAPELQLELFDVARGFEFLLGPQDVELRHVAEIHGEEAGRLVLTFATLVGG